MKDVKATASKLGLKPNVSYLWDDNEVKTLNSKPSFSIPNLKT